MCLLTPGILSRSVEVTLAPLLLGVPTLGTELKDVLNLVTLGLSLGVLFLPAPLEGNSQVKNSRDLEALPSDKSS